MAAAEQSENVEPECEGKGKKKRDWGARRRAEKEN